MSILMSVISSDPYMTDYLSKKDAVMTAFPSTNKVRRAGRPTLLARALARSSLRHRAHISSLPPGNIWGAAPRSRACRCTQCRRLAPQWTRSPPPGHTYAHTQATTGFLSRINKYAGVALQDQAFTRSVFDYMIVPGRAWSTAELAAAAPVQLKTL